MHSTPQVATQPIVIPLWPGGVPGSEDWTQQEQTSILPPGGHPVVRNVTQPTLTAYLPDPTVANGTAVIVCPGGGFHFLSIGFEGTDVAEWLAARGIAAFVLKYRLIRTTDNFATEVWQNLGDRSRMAQLMRPLTPLILADGQQAVRLVRQRAVEWGVATDRIGIMGFSAGGAVTVNVVLQCDAGSRPDFAAAIYAAHALDIPAPADAPPIFVLCADDDALVPSAASLGLYNTWKAAARPVELHVYQKGGHGFGMRKQGLPTDAWIERFGEWLQAQGLLAPSQPDALYGRFTGRDLLDDLEQEHRRELEPNK
jgi:acetyl esterase/lipase